MGTIESGAPVEPLWKRALSWIKNAFLTAGRFFVRYPFAVVGTVLLVALAVLLAVFGRRLQIGGLLGRLWGRDSPEPDAVLRPPPGRVDPGTGKPIELGQSDPNGFVQPVAVELKKPGIFSDPDKITVVAPGGKEVEVKLPTGVKSEDVKQVVMVAPNVFQVANKDRGVDAGKLLEDLKK
jgi:hypothetical protein